VLSPLLANIALAVLDEHLHAPWRPAGDMSTKTRRRGRRWKELPNWRLVRYADDFVVLTDGTSQQLSALRERIAEVLAPMGLAFSEAKTKIVHMSEGFDFLGFHIQWRRKRGTNCWYVYTFVADRPLKSVKAKIKTLTPRTSQADLKDTLIRINQISRGWANYFRHAVASHTFDHLHQFTWWRIVRWQQTRHRWRWKDVRRWLTDRTGRWQPITAEDVILFDPTRIAIRRYRYRGGKIPTPFPARLTTTPTATTVESPVR
jgi:RNA-directed DNA polymerase